MRVARHARDLACATILLLAPLGLALPLGARAQPVTEPVAGAAPLQDLRVIGERLVFRDERGPHEVFLGCGALEALTFGREVYLSCGRAEVLRMRIPPGGEPELSRSPLPLPIRRLLVARGAIWAQLRDGSTRRVARLHAPSDPDPALDPVPAQNPDPSLAPAAPTGPAAALGDPSAGATEGSDPGEEGGQAEEVREPEVAFQGRVGVVREVEEEGRAIVELDPGARLFVGQAVELVRPRGERDPLLGEADVVRVATARVTRFDLAEAELRLAVNEGAEPGLLVRATPSGSGLSVMPPLPSDSFELSYRARALIGIEGGGGVIQGLRALYQSSFGLRLGVELSPVGLGAHDWEGEYLSASLHGILGFGSRWGGLELGLGWVTLPQWDDSVAHVFSLAPRVRFGNEDGLSVSLHFQILFNEELWQNGAVDADLRIPVGHGVWLLLEGGWWLSGQIYADLGARVLLSGNGRGQTLYLTLHGGWGWLLARGRDTTGPTLGGGLTWRL